MSTAVHLACVARCGLVASLLLPLLAIACSNGTTPDCSDAQCGTSTSLPPLDATLDTAAPDGGDDSGEEEGGDAATATGTDGSSDASSDGSSDAAVDQSAAPTDASDDAHDDAHIADSGHDSSG
jgi:hypothetical protein